MVDPLVTIVITNYNYEAYVGEAIESALGQDYRRTEVVVVDDGSTDGSRTVIDAYAERVNVVPQENAGQAAAFNAGFMASRGDLVLFLDADDVLDSSAISKVVAAWEPGAAKVQFRLECCDAALRPLGRTAPTRTVAMPNGDVAQQVLKSAGSVAPPTSGNAFSRECLLRILPMPTETYRLCADAYLVLLATLHGEVRSLDEALGKYRIHGQNNWTSSATDGVRMRRMLRNDELRGRMLADHAATLGYRVEKRAMQRNPAHLATRLASLRADPAEHPFPEDHRAALAARGLRAVWSTKQGTFRKRLATMLWFLAVAGLPRRLAVRLVAWMFDPGQRPPWFRTGVAKPEHPAASTLSSGAS